MLALVDAVAEVGGVLGEPSCAEALEAPLPMPALSLDSSPITDEASCTLLAFMRLLALLAEVIRFTTIVQFRAASVVGDDDTLAEAMSENSEASTEGKGATGGGGAGSIRRRDDAAAVAPTGFPIESFSKHMLLAYILWAMLDWGSENGSGDVTLKICGCDTREAGRARPKKDGGGSVVGWLDVCKSDTLPKSTAISVYTATKTLYLFDPIHEFVAIHKVTPRV